MNTVTTTVQHNLCVSCGICKGICPKNCISYQRNRGMYIPVIDSSVCVRCGLCADVCPGLSHSYAPKATAAETVTGSVLGCYNAWSKDLELRHASASGGVVSTIIRELLATGSYDGAFCLDTYDYHNQLKTRLYTADEIACGWHSSNAPKSRYLPVSHENAIAYIKTHRDARLIFIGTSCALRALDAAIQKLNRSRDPYLFIGLFCDKVFNYNVLTYFEDRFCNKKRLSALHFKNKESGGWPGDMKFFPEDGEPFYVPLAERAKAKAYFMPERCLYCVDKLNLFADISLGDNYTGISSSELGTNSVILRTQRGMDVWEIVSDQLGSVPLDIKHIQTAQDINWRLNNLCYADLKAKKTKGGIDLNPGVPREQCAFDYQAAWDESLKRLNCGLVYDTSPEKLERLLLPARKKANRITAFAKRSYYYLRRKIKRGLP